MTSQKSSRGAKTLAAYLALAIIGLPFGAAHAQPPVKARGASDRAAIVAALTAQMSHATPLNPAIGPITVSGLTVAGAWAKALVTPRRPGMDPVTTLLHKTGGRWRVVTLGTDLQGTGKQYGVPRALWSRWGL